MTFDQFWKQCLPAEVDELKPIFEECWKEAFREASHIAAFDSMKDWTGGSTGNAVGTARNIVTALLREAMG